MSADRPFSGPDHHEASVVSRTWNHSERDHASGIRHRDAESASRFANAPPPGPRARSVHVFIAGTGRVGAALLDQLAAQAGSVASRSGLELVVAGIACTRSAAFDAAGLDLHTWRDALTPSVTPARRLVEAAVHSASPFRVFVDCTASVAVADEYEDLLACGVAIVTANKIAFSGSSSQYHRLREAALNGGIHAETTVGAGLPVLGPVADMVTTGDTVIRIEGVLSGTLSCIFGLVNAGLPFSHAVREAHGQGFTEPDPREDLSGRDVARKLVILGREAGFEISPEAVHIPPILPGDGWYDVNLDAFWERLPAADSVFARRRAEALAGDGVLACTASIDNTGAGLEVRAIPTAHPLATLAPGDNLIVVTSRRYCERPLIVRGPGAGPEVTAAGVFADLLRAAAEAR